MKSLILTALLFSTSLAIAQSSSQIEKKYERYENGKLVEHHYYLEQDGRVVAGEDFNIPQSAAFQSIDIDKKMHEMELKMNQMQLKIDSKMNSLNQRMEEQMLRLNQQILQFELEFDKQFNDLDFKDTNPSASPTSFT